MRQFPFVSMICIIERISLFETAQINNVYSLEGVWPARLMHMMVSFLIYGFTYIALIRSSIIGIALSIVIFNISLKHSSITFAQVPTSVMVLMGALVLYGPGYLMMLNFPKPKTAGGNDSD